MKKGKTRTLGNDRPDYYLRTAEGNVDRCDLEISGNIKVEGYHADGLKEAEKQVEIALSNRILKIGLARGTGGISGRINSYPNMQKSITRYVFGTDVCDSVELFFILTEDGYSAEDLEEKAIFSYRRLCGSNEYLPPWEQVNWGRE